MRGRVVRSAFLAAAMAVFAGLAFTNVAHAEAVMILDSTGLTSAFATGGEFKLGANVTLAGSYAPAADLSIDLNVSHLIPRVRRWLSNIP